MSNLAQSVVVVTGASTGIGRATAHRRKLAHALTAALSGLLRGRR
jgi:NADP-dependent 3-hydroxy acid dehydrogenase YdfG